MRNRPSTFAFIKRGPKLSNSGRLSGAMVTKKIDDYVGPYESIYACMTPEDKLLEIVRILNSATKPMAKLVAIAIVSNSPP